MITYNATRNQPKLTSNDLGLKRVQLVGKSYVNDNGERVWVTREPHHVIMRTGWDRPM